MACENMYVPIQERSQDDILNDQRDEALQQLEQELGMGTAQIVQDPYTGAVTIEGASVMPEGMSDICVLDALNSRNSMEFQLATGNAGLQDYDFAGAHGHSHHH
jgi:hypothetical protein